MAGNNAQLYEQARPLSIMDLRHTLVVAPHPDDESLGCGGTIALLRKAGLPVHVVFISDGSMSHPASKKYGVKERIEVREAEAIHALQILGVDKAGITFMKLSDSKVPAGDQPDFLETTITFEKIVAAVQPATILVPWRRDPHKDHRASWQIVNAALGNHSVPIRVLEYFIWLWERAESSDLPLQNEARLWHVNIESVIRLKQQAVMAHVSQVTNLIDDDSNGFILSPEVLAHFSGNRELFAEVVVR